MTVSVQCYSVEHSSRHLLAEAQETGRHKEIMFTSSKGRVQSFLWFSYKHLAFFFSFTLKDLDYPLWWWGTQKVQRGGKATTTVLGVVPGRISLHMVRSFCTDHRVSALFTSCCSSSDFSVMWTTSVRPLLPRTQGTLRKTSSLMPYMPWHIRKRQISRKYKARTTLSSAVNDSLYTVKNVMLFDSSGVDPPLHLTPGRLAVYIRDVHTFLLLEWLGNWNCFIYIYSYKLTYKHTLYVWILIKQMLLYGTIWFNSYSIWLLTAHCKKQVNTKRSNYILMLHCTCYILSYFLQLLIVLDLCVIDLNVSCCSFSLPWV